LSAVLVSNIRDFGGERAGIRTLDLLIKSQLLYRLSYALPGGAKTPRGSARNICRRVCRVNPENAMKNSFCCISPRSPKGDWQDEASADTRKRKWRSGRGIYGPEPLSPAVAE
jgi:hypothetical protein